MDEQSEKFIEEVRQSKYFDYVVEAKVDEKWAEVKKKYKTRFVAFITLIGALLGLLGYSMNELFEDYIARIHDAGNLASEYSAMIANIRTADSLNRQTGMYALNFEKQILAERRQLDDEIRQGFTERLQRLDEMNLETTLESLDRVRQQTLTENQRMQELVDAYANHKARTDSNLRALSNISDDIKKTSVRYVFVERGDEAVNGREYRPAKIQLPFSRDTLEARFHTNYRSTHPKRTLVNIYGNHQLLFEDLLLTDSEAQMNQARAEFCSSEGLKYEIEPVYIYLPPNFLLSNVIPGYGRVPDFVIFAVRLVDLTCSSEFRIASM